MKRLRKRDMRIDNLHSEARPIKRGRAGRYIYLSTVALLFLGIFDMSAGSFLYLKAEGMVTQETSAVAPPYSGMVQSIFIREGQKVERGRQIAQTRAEQMISDIAQLSNEFAIVQSQVSEMRIQRDKLHTLIPTAQQRAGSLEQYRLDLQGLQNSGYSTITHQAIAINDSFDAEEDLALLKAEIKITNTELLRAEQASARARTAVLSLEELYDDGRILAPQSGIVAKVAINEGGGFEVGTSIAEIFHGSPYVLAFVPVGKVYEIKPGDKVTIRYGFQTVKGEIERLMPIAPRLPQEFQRAFQTIEHQQLIRISLDPMSAPPPLFTEVEITSRFSLRVLSAQIVSGLARVIGLHN